jgi:hypothetical protein
MSAAKLFPGLSSCWASITACPRRCSPPPFAPAWQSFCSSSADRASVRVQLGQAFPAPGADPPVAVDLGSKAVSYVTPRGTKRADIPVDYAWRMAHPRLATMDHEEAGALQDEDPLHQSTEAELPLLTRAEADLTPADQIAPALLAAHPLTPGVHLPDPSAAARQQTSGPGPAAPPSAPAPGLTGEALMQALLLEQRATNAALRGQLQVLSDSVVSIQHRLAVQTPGLAPGLSTSAHANLDSPPASRAARGEGDRGLICHDAAVSSRSPPQLRHDPGPTRRGAASPDQRFRSRSPRWSSRSRSPVRRRSRSRSRRHDRGARSPHRRSPSPARRFSRSRSRNRSRRRSRSARRGRRSLSPTRPPQGHLPTGNNLFRPSPNEMTIHTAARVGPRFQEPDTGTNDALSRFANMCPHDRVCFMLRQERFRGQYRATKVTSKMIFSVDFSSRPLDYFLASEAPGAYHQDRNVLHEDSQWGGPDPPPVTPIRRADQLHQVLYTIQDAASMWYPADLAAVFRYVHGDAVQSLQPQAPPQLLSAMCNLYQLIFSALSDDLIHGMDIREAPRSGNGLGARSSRASGSGERCGEAMDVSDP